LAPCRDSDVSHGKSFDNALTIRIRLQPTDESNGQSCGDACTTSMLWRAHGVTEGSDSSPSSRRGKAYGACSSTSASRATGPPPARIVDAWADG
jgi:hypothetical protein